MTIPSKNDLGALLNPSSVAVIGASDDPRRIGGRPVHYLKSRGYDGRVYPVNPKRDVVQGLTCYPDIESLPEAPDLAIIAVPGKHVLDTVKRLAARGTRGCVIFSAGFAEMGDEGEAAQNELLAIARASGMRLVGPNCLGIFNANRGMFATFTTALEQNTPTGGNVAIATQSGAYGSHLSMIATRRGMPVGYWITTGNEADVQVAECIEWLAAQPDVRVIIAYSEGVTDGPRMVRALEAARASRTAVVFLKTGRSEVGTLAATSHTASLTGEDRVYDAAFRQLGVYRAHDTEDALDAAEAASAGQFPKDRRTGIVTVSGGVGIHMADVAEELTLEVTEMPADAQADLVSQLPYASARNPLDVTAQVINDAALFGQFLETSLERGGYSSIAIYFSFVAGADFMIEPIATSLRSVNERYPDTPIILSVVVNEETARIYRDAGCIVIEDPWRAMRMIAALAHFEQGFSRAGLERPDTPSKPLDQSSRTELDTKQMLTSIGIRAPAENLAADATSACDAARTIGFPVVLKVVSPDITHKTEVGGVVTDIHSESELTDAVNAMRARVIEKAPDAKLEGFLIAEQISNGTEVIVGIKNDPVFGPVVLFGPGGILVEVLDDAALRLAPFDLAEAEGMIESTRVHRILEGVRGEPRRDIGALAKSLVAISEFAWRHRDSIDSLDVNPLLVLEDGQGVVALDALLIRSDQDGTS